jgi:RecA-family ATPase
MSNYTPNPNGSTPFWQQISHHQIFCGFDIKPRAKDPSKMDKHPKAMDGLTGIKENASIDKLGTYEQAKALGFPFVGLSFTRPISIIGKQLVCIDLDWKNAPDGLAHPKQMELMCELSGHSYETSYSGQGAHYWVLCDKDQIPESIVLSPYHEIEIFAGVKPGRAMNVLITDYDASGELKNSYLKEVFEKLEMVPYIEYVKPKAPSEIQHRANASDIEMALDYIPADHYEIWIKVGMALKEELGDDGFDLWDKWSQKSDKYDPTDTVFKWGSFKGQGITAGTLIALAREHGYTSYEKSSALEDFCLDPDTGELVPVPKANPWFDRIRTISKVNVPPNWLVDGILADKLTIIAGSPGVGKTSCLVPLALVIAGFQSHLSNVEAKYNRKVIYVTEDKWQIDSIIHGVIKHLVTPDGQKITYEMVAERFIVIETMKSKVSELILLADVAAGFIEDLEAASGQVEMKPLIVLDTSSATFLLDDENNNSEVSKYVAAIKESFINKDYPVWIVAHTAKINKRSEVAALSVRGAGAFEGDANCIAYLVQEEGLNTRFFVLGKHRYSAKYNEIAIDSVLHHEMAVNKYGDIEEVYYRYSTLERSSETDRIAAKMEAKEQHEESKESMYKQRIFDKLAELGATSPTKLSKSVAGNNAKNLSLINQMLMDGELVSEPGKAGGISLKRAN